MEVELLMDVLISRLLIGVGRSKAAYWQNKQSCLLAICRSSSNKHGCLLSEQVGLLIDSKQPTLLKQLISDQAAGRVFL